MTHWSGVVLGVVAALVATWVVFPPIALALGYVRLRNDVREDYDFSASWCGPCRQMEKELFADPEAASFISASYLPVRVPDEDHGVASVALRDEHTVDGLPTLIVVHGLKNDTRRLEGYPGKRRTLAFLKRALTARPAAKANDE